jgi:hypothetical protein
LCWLLVGKNEGRKESRVVTRRINGEEQERNRG